MKKPPEWVASSLRPNVWGAMRRYILYLLYVVAFYLVITAYFGYRLGAKIHAAKSNPYVGVGSLVLGSKATETYMIQQSNLPVLITASPAFWLALHLTE
jgi:hypothetical protein